MTFRVSESPKAKTSRSLEEDKPRWQGQSTDMAIVLRRLRKNDDLQPLHVAAIKNANPEWRNVEQFSAYDAKSDGGRRRRRGRPVAGVNVIYMTLAWVSYFKTSLLFKRCADRSTRNFLAQKLDPHADLILCDSKLAAELAVKEWGLNVSGAWLLVWISNRRRYHRLRAAAEIVAT